MTGEKEDTIQSLKVINKFGLGTAPIVQITTGVAEAAYVSNVGGVVVNDDSTFGGYTIQQVVQALQNYGMLA